MKTKTIITAIFAAIFLALAVQSVSAYHNSYAHNPHGTRIVYGFDGDFNAQDYRYVDDYYGRPMYKVYRNNCDHNCWHDDEITREQAVRWTLRSYNKRYYETAGESSGKAFCKNCVYEEKNTPSNWRNKKAYNLLADGPGGTEDYYYEVKYDYKQDKFNWRF